MKIRQWEGQVNPCELTDRKTDGHDKNLTVAFRSFANAPKKKGTQNNPQSKLNLDDY
jgi:hypothetical protein